MILTSANPRPLRHDEDTGSEARQRASPVDRVSVIVPVRDEASSIVALLDALTGQTQPPSEIVITDGGSTDLTREIIRDRQSSSPVPIILIETEHAFPGRGRNLAIAGATHQWIASIDAGIRPRPDWLAQLVASAEREPLAEVIYGIAEPLTNTYFTECAAITYVPGGRITKSIASCLLHRAAWLKTGGFREDLRSAEDLLFFESLDAANVLTARCHEAVVLWELCPTLMSTFRRFVIYSRNGMRAGLAHEWQYHVTWLYLLMLVILLASVWFRPLLVVPPMLLFLRAEKRIWQWYRAQSQKRVWRQMLRPDRVLFVTWINVVIDIATFCGMWQWFVHDRSVPRSKWPTDDGSSA